jgi:hypothetical protein
MCNLYDVIHSERRQSMGSDRIARRIGTMHAATAALMRSKAAPPITNGSPPLTSNSIGAM